MKQIEYIIETLAPVTFAEKNNESTLYNTKKYVPGSIFRGMLANKYIRENKLENAHENEDFYNIFLSGKARFLPAYPIGKNNKKDFEPYVLPLSFMKNKSGQELRDIAGDAKIETGFKKITGFALKSDNEIYKVNVDTQIEFHMARSEEIERIHGSSKEGRVFNYEYIEPYQYFKGYIITDNDIADKVEQCLKMVNKHFYIGRSRNVQYGECALSNIKIKNCEVQKFNTNGKLYLYAYTPYIPQKEWQRVDYVADDLCKQINEKLNIEITKGENIFATAEEYSGYVSVWNARRERKTAISAGSLIEIKLNNTDEIVLKSLSDILYNGLGERTSEGFGQFRLYKPFESLSLKNLEDAPNKNYELSTEVKELAKKIIKERIFTEIKKQAVDDGNEKFKFSSTSKTILNRIEKLVNSNKTKQEIQLEINSFNKTAIDNLEKMFIGTDNLFEILTEKVNLPYINIQWEKRLGLNDQVEEMKKDLGKDVFAIDEEILYHKYFLWFVRHAKKVLREKEQI